MNLVTLENVEKYIGDRRLFAGVDLRVNEGDRIGLIGVNGSGKSTLLRVIAAVEPPDAGRVTLWGGVRVQFLPQEPELDEDATALEHLLGGSAADLVLLRRYREAARQLEEGEGDQELVERLAALSAEMDTVGAWGAEVRAKTVLTRLGVDVLDRPIRTLSGGERKRVALARALVDPADLLILDEPTNHIDAQAVAWLEGYLLEVPKALVMVTHDRYFLDRVVNRITELDRRQIVSYPGNYERYLALRTERDERLRGAEQQRRKLLRRELEWLRRAPKARGTKQKARRQRVEELEQIRSDSGEERVSMALGSRRLGKKVLVARDLSMAYGDLVLFHALDFDLEPGERIGIVGPNGAGKSTLLDVLAGRTAPDEGAVTWGESVHLGYYDQAAVRLDDDARVIRFIEELAPLVTTSDGERVTASQMLEWFLFDRELQWSLVGSLSGGERRRLYLLATLIQRPNVIFLDEPTNDLDLPTLQVLEAFLDRFDGTLVVVSHDRYFLDRTVDELVHLEGGRLSLRYPTPFELYQRLRSEGEVGQDETAGYAPGPARAEAAQARATRSRRRGDRGLSWREQRELEELNTTIAWLEERQSEAEAELLSCGSDYVKAGRLAEEIESIRERMDGLLGRWLELSEREQT